MLTFNIRSTEIFPKAEKTVIYTISYIFGLLNTTLEVFEKYGRAYYPKPDPEDQVLDNK